MTESIWGRAFAFLRQPAKRRQRMDLLGGLHAERLEDRALLTARAFEFPTVDGTWSIEINGEPSGESTITQDGKKVTGTYTISGLPTVQFTDKFTKKTPDSLSAKIKIKDEELGKFTISVGVDFGTSTGSPTTFIGSALTPQGTIDFAGIKQVGTAALPKKAVDFEDVAGTYDFTITQAQLGTIEGVLNLTQDGKGGKNLQGTVTIPDSAPIIFSAKFEKKDPSTISGTVSVPVQELGRTIKAKATAQFTIEFDSFAGTATIRGTTPAEFSATLQQ